MRPLTVLAPLIVLSVSSGALAADWEGVFEGKLGKGKVIVELNAGADQSDYKGGFSDGSRYSYYPKIFDLNLVLDDESDDGTLSFTESTARHFDVSDLPAGDPKITGHWTLSVDDAGAKGTWTSPDGKKKLPISLKRVDLVEEGSLPEHGNQLSQTYNELWFRSVSFVPTEKQVKFGDITMTYMKDSAFGQDVPVLTTFPDAARMAKANDLLNGYYRQSLMSYRDCVNGVPGEWRNSDEKLEVEYQLEAVYASPTIVSIEERGSVFCGGAHPSNYVTPLTFDLETLTQIGGIYGRDLSPDGFGHVFKLANKEERAAFEDFALGRWQEAAKADPSAVEEDGCAGMGFLGEQPAGEKEFSLSFVASGLAVRRKDYPHVASNCLFQDFNPTIVPWADLKPWLKAGQKLLINEIK